MKITGYSDSLRVTFSHGRDIGSLLKGISVGDRVEARIVSREGNIALLDIAGKRIRADFTSGIPSGNTVELILTEKNSSSAVFRLPATESTSSLTGFLKQHFMAGDVTPDRGLIAELLRMSSGNRPGMSEINLFLSGIKKDRLNGKNLTDLINRLVSLKVPEQTITDISLAAASKLPAPVFSAMLFFMDKTGRRHGFTTDENRIDAILADIEDIDDELFADLLKLLAAQPENEGSGNILLHGEGKPSNFEYVYRDGLFFMTFSLSELGPINLLVRNEGGQIFISIGAENDRVLTMLEADSGELGESLKKNGLETVIISFFNTKKVVDKLHNLCSVFQLASGIDVKI